MRDSAEFDRFYRETAPRVTRYGFALTGDLADAQDLTQEAFIRAWQRWGQVSRYEYPESWIRVVVTRLATDRWRGLRVRRRALPRLVPPEHVPPPTEDSVLLIRALGALPLKQRQVIALHYLCDMSVAEIAAETGAATGSVKVWLSRGRAALAAQLGSPLMEANNAE